VVGVAKVGPDDLARGVDAVCEGANGGRGIVEGGVSAAAEKEAVEGAGAPVIPDDLARGVDALRNGTGRGQGIIEGSIRATAFEEAMMATAVVEIPDDLVHIIDAECLGGADAGRIIEGVEETEWHDLGSSVIVSLAASIRKAQPGSNSC
jgi:hypothetical protein